MMSYNNASSPYAPSLLAQPARSQLENQSEEFAANREDMLKRLSGLDELLDETSLRGGKRHQQRLVKLGKLSVRERVALVLDPDSSFFEISALTGYNTSYTIGGVTLGGINLGLE